MKKTILRILIVAMMASFGAFLMTACRDPEPTPPAPATYRVVYADGVDDETIAVPTDSNNYAAGDTVTVKAGITRTNYTFTGWSDSTGTYQEGDTFTMPARNVQLTAGWALDTYTVTYTAGDAEDAQGLPASAEAPNGAYNLPQTEPTCEGKKFLGWKVDGDDTLYKYGSAHASYTVAGEAVEFVAQWQQLYKLTYADGVEDAEIAVPAGAYYEENAEITVKGIDRDIRTGYYFAGWQKTPEGVDDEEVYGEDGMFQMPASDVTLTAVWVSSDIEGMWTGSDENYTYEITIAKGTVEDNPAAVGRFLYKSTYTDFGTSQYFLYPIVIRNGAYTLIDGMTNAQFEIGSDGLVYHDLSGDKTCPTKAALPAAPTGLNGTWHGLIGDDTMQSELTIGDEISFSRPDYQNDPVNEIEFVGYEHFTIGKYYVILIETSVGGTETAIVSQASGGVAVYFQGENTTFTSGAAVSTYCVTFELDDGTAQPSHTRYVDRGAEIGTLPVVFTSEEWGSRGQGQTPDYDYFDLAAGYEFDGWFVEGQDEAINEHYIVNADTMVTAKLHSTQGGGGGDTGDEYADAPTVTFHASDDPDAETWILPKDSQHYRKDKSDWYVIPFDTNEAGFTNADGKEWLGWWYYGMSDDGWNKVPVRFEDEIMISAYGTDFYSEEEPTEADFNIYALWEGDDIFGGEEPATPVIEGTWTASGDVTATFIITSESAFEEGSLVSRYYGVLVVGTGTDLKAVYGEVVEGGESGGFYTYTFLGGTFLMMIDSEGFTLTIALGSAEEETRITFTSRTDTVLNGPCYPSDKTSEWTFGEGDGQYTFIFNTTLASMQVGSAEAQNAKVLARWSDYFVITTELENYPDASDTTFIVMRIDNTWYAIDGDGAHALTKKSA